MMNSGCEWHAIEHSPLTAHREATSDFQPPVYANAWKISLYLDLLEFPDWNGVQIFFWASYSAFWETIGGGRVQARQCIMMVCLNCGVPFHSCVALSKFVILLHFSNICKIEIVFHRIVSRILTFPKSVTSHLSNSNSHQHTQWLLIPMG